MTKNLYEPSTQTDLANQGYRIRQLERRPASAGGAGGAGACLPYAVISKDFPGGTPIATGTEVLFQDLGLFTDGYVSDTDAFTNQLAGGSIDYNETGLYLAEVSLEWETAFAGVKLATVYWSATLFDPIAIYTEDMEANKNQNHAQSFVFAAAEGSPGNVQGSIEQQSGVSQDLVNATLKIIRLAVHPAEADCAPGGAPVSWLSLDADTAVASGPPATTILAGAENSFDSDPSILLADPTNGWIDILEPGFYLAKFRGCWGSAATTVSALISWEADTIGSSPCGSSFDLFEDASGTAWGLTGSDLIVDIAATSRVRPSIQHITGAPRDVTFAYCAVTRVSPYDETPSS